MPSLARRWDRDSRRRPASARYDLEVLEGRTLLSGAGASTVEPSATVSTSMVLDQSLKTAVTGANVTFAAVIQNSSTHAPVTTGKVNFTTRGPEDLNLGNVSVNGAGVAAVTTSLLTKPSNYTIEASYAPHNGRFAPASATTTVHVIPQPIHVPTRVILVTGAPRAESGQSVPLLAVVKDAGTGNQVDAGKVLPISGTLQFYSRSPQSILLGQVTINQATITSSSSLVQALQSMFGQTNQAAVQAGKNSATLSTNKLTRVGPNDIEAKFTPSNSDFTASTSAPLRVTITPSTFHDPTTTALQASTTTIEKGEDISFYASVQNHSSSLAGGVVEFMTMGPHPVLLGKVTVNGFDQQLSLTTGKLQKAGDYHVQAVYLPGNSRFAESASAPVTITVTPMTATSFRVTPVRRYGAVKQPVSFTVTAVDSRGRPVTNYDGTVFVYSPTDSLPNFPPSTYTALNIGPPSPATPGLARITPTSYTFTTADHGSHTFVNGVTFGKGGAERIRITQASDSKVQGEATFAIE
ncbi:MAG: Ig-like domain repeat protein [Isosphaeraceae bacterium]